MGAGMPAFDLRYVDAQRGRDGRVQHYYFRRNGRRWVLPGKPLSEEFMEEYRRLVDATTPGVMGEAPADKRTYPPGSFGALINDYLDSGEFKDNKPRTKAEYKRVLEALQERHGNKPLRQLRRRHVRKMRDERAETPGAANTVVRMLKIVLNFAVEEEWIEASPAAKMKLLRVGEWRAWSAEECAAYEKRWDPGTMQRRAYALARYTGQRKSDLVLMTRAHRKSGTIRVVQGKGGEELWIPEHRALKEELALGPQDHMSLLTTSQGKAFDPVYFGAWMADAIADAGLPDDCVLHGLRKVAARDLADAGCTEEEIKAITGHVTSQMVSHYVKAADKRKRASAAIHKLENTK
jgi:enterobacteria phage integrase